ncbi:hypothetical protein [Nitratiruptor sp. YY09-18]|uniref:hypothetical protein n=1 Tax=Nitratiruptor sp. YY09-18 TaxID=2724901 RepID=UPI0019153C5B|nr:hypothetical protein [Nitratiruptor sp. YY09-18]
MLKAIIMLVIMSFAINAQTVIAHISKGDITEYAVKCDNNVTRFIQEKNGVYYSGGTEFSSLQKVVNNICKNK